eukprot:SAG31_NODE_5341_length_2599_cov_1.845600_2_plen_176_part_00
MQKNENVTPLTGHGRGVESRAEVRPDQAVGGVPEEHTPVALPRNQHPELGQGRAGGAELKERLLRLHGVRERGDDRVGDGRDHRANEEDRADLVRLDHRDEVQRPERVVEPEADELCGLEHLPQADLLLRLRGARLLLASHRGLAAAALHSPRRHSRPAKKEPKSRHLDPQSRKN